MADCMTFPEDWHDFLEDYSFDDSEEVYTNCSRLIPVNRVEQLIDHLLKAQEPVKPILKREGWNKYHNDYVCPVCDQELVYEQNFCSECGREVKWK